MALPWNRREPIENQMQPANTFTAIETHNQSVVLGAVPLTGWQYDQDQQQPIDENHTVTSVVRVLN